MPLWISITIAAALFQNIRTTMQQKIRHVLSVDGANFIRYLYGAPGANLEIGGELVIKAADENGLPALKGYEAGLSGESFETVTKDGGSFEVQNNIIAKRILGLPDLTKST